MYHTHYYLPVEGASLFTAVFLPEKDGKFPIVLMRSPYVDEVENLPEEEILIRMEKEWSPWLMRGYALVYQHCRGRGKSDGDCIPYINEREDGLALQSWVRTQPFYDGTILLKGGSYLTSVHYATAPFAPDIKGAVFGIQDSERYHINYRNGAYKKGGHTGWYMNMYKAKSHTEKKDVSPDLLPYINYSEAVLGEPAEDFDEILRHPDPSDPFWNTRFGGGDARGATDSAIFPMLFTTGFYDIYTGGIFEMWRKLKPIAKAQSALVVSAYTHGDNPAESPIRFSNGSRNEAFGELYEIDWFDYILGKRKTAPFAPGKVTYYKLFANEWATDDFAISDDITFPLGNKPVTYTYDPADPPSFKGGLSLNFGGPAYQDAPGTRGDVITVYSLPFERDVLIKGAMEASLTVSSDAEDTGFYMRVSIEKEGGDYGLRDDITSLLFQLKEYTPGNKVNLHFRFDEHAFLIQKGERLRIDIASAENTNFFRHTNTKGLFSEATETKIAHNTVYLCESTLTVPISL